jgi:hypothetical protein
LPHHIINDIIVTLVIVWWLILGTLVISVNISVNTMLVPSSPHVKHVVRFYYNASFCSQNALLLLMLVIMDTLSHFILVLYLYHDCIVILVTMLIAKKSYFCSSDIWGIPYLFCPIQIFTSQSNLVAFIYICTIMLKKTSAIWM